MTHDYANRSKMTKAPKNRKLTTVFVLLTCLIALGIMLFFILKQHHRRQQITKALPAHSTTNPDQNLTQYDFYTILPKNPTTLDAKN
jgi:hypothetical protein